MSFEPKERGVPALLIRHRVRDFDVWKRAFLDDVETRRANGAHAARLYRNAADPKEVWILLQWDDLFRMHLFVQSDDLREGLDRAGVIDRPDYWYLEDADPAIP